LGKDWFKKAIEGGSLRFCGIAPFRLIKKTEQLEEAMGELRSYMSSYPTTYFSPITIERLLQLWGYLRNKTMKLGWQVIN